jgi:hypothetical protein
VREQAAAVARERAQVISFLLSLLLVFLSLLSLLLVGTKVRILTLRLIRPPQKQRLIAHERRELARSRVQYEVQVHTKSQVYSLS